MNLSRRYSDAGAATGWPAITTTRRPSDGPVRRRGRGHATEADKKTKTISSVKIEEINKFILSELTVFVAGFQARPNKAP